MNSLSSLLKICHQLPDEEDALSHYKAEQFTLQTPNGKSVADVGCEPILHMRNFQVSVSYNCGRSPLCQKHNVLLDSPLDSSIPQATKKLPEKLISQILDS